MITSSDLSQFTGTENYTRYAPFGGRGIVLTDGARFLAENGHFWLMDILISLWAHPNKKKIWDTEDGFRSAKLFKQDFSNKAIFILDDGNGNILYTQKIEFTDTPLKEIQLFIEFDGENWIVLLPSEH